MRRPIWKGFISFGLVNIPVTIHSAEKRTQLHFHLVDSRNKARIHYERINDETGKEVPWDKVVKAFEYVKGNYVILEEDELKSAAIEATQTIDILNFVAKKDIDDLYFDKPYYLVPEKKAVKGYVLLRMALEETDKVGIAKVVIRTRQYICAIEASNNCLMLNLMRYEQEIIPAEKYEFPEKKLSDYNITKQEIQLSKNLIEEMSAKWDPSQYKDDYQQKVMKIIEKKIEYGGRLPIGKKEKIKGSDNVIDFVSAFKKSLANKKKHSTSLAKDSPKKKRVGARR